MYWTSGSGRIELSITKSQVQSGYHQGQCDDDIDALANVPAIKRQLAKIDHKLLARELEEFGTWDVMELSDHDNNLRRILWLACGDLCDNAKGE